MRFEGGAEDVAEELGIPPKVLQRINTAIKSNSLRIVIDTETHDGNNPLFSIGTIIRFKLSITEGNAEIFTRWYHNFNKAAKIVDFIGQNFRLRE